MRHFERLGVLDQNAVPRCHAGAGHDGGGRGQPERARAGNHQHRDGVQDGGFPVARRQAPAQQRDEGQADDHRHKHRADLIDQPLDRCFFGLRRLDHAHDARQRRFGADGRGAHDDQPFGIDRAAGDVVTGLLADRQAFAGDQRLVHFGRAFDDFAIDRDAFARPHDDLIANLDRTDRHLRVHALTPKPRGFRPQCIQRANRFSGLALGARLHPFAQQHQRDDDRRRFKIQVRHAVFVLREQQVNAQSVSR